jgi:two-component system KDP operon response regulator KdpE
MACGPCILIIDEDQDIRDFLTLALDDEGYQSITAGNGKRAIDTLPQCWPSLILIDSHVPYMDKPGFLSAYHDIVDVGAPIVMLTTSLCPDVTAARIHADAILEKPFNLDDLLQVVDHFMKAA